jgi:hypothetical protein
VIDLQGAMRSSVRLPVMRPGRPLRTSDREQIEARSFPGIAISRRLDASMLVPGVNTLAVSVIDGRGRFRIQRSSVFVVVPAASRPKPNLGRPHPKPVPAPPFASHRLDDMPASTRAAVVRLLGVGASDVATVPAHG